MKIEMQVVVPDMQMVGLGTVAYSDLVAGSASMKNLGDSATRDCKFQKKGPLVDFLYSLKALTSSIGFSANRVGQF
jgi:hypothetical protein